jgi:hypothetical protein
MAERGRFLATLEGEQEEAFEGILLDWDESHFILGDAAQVNVTPDGKTQRLAVDHDLWIPRSRIKYLQRIPHTH